MISARNVTIARGERILWQDLTLDIADGEFIAVLGPNGAGKTSFIDALLGILRTTTGTLRINDQLAGMSGHTIGYIPQHANSTAATFVRGIDIVRMGLEGHTYGLAKRTKTDDAYIAEVIGWVDATDYAYQPFATLSGGQRQRLRVAQALVGKPSIVLCDEPLVSLDLASQQTITALLHRYQVEHGATIIFVTHEINPILPYVDRVLYIAHGQWLCDLPSKVLRTKTLSALYGSPVEVLHAKGRIIIVGGESNAHHEDAT